ncbi:hypothetical protein DPMN_085287 [Dreissena polymorpha]|uniref:Uncharacterized protein n=1 Tax=Dreissena polymorpha TaxID=45954 RepID=A0A9D4BK41_DREPO|nr:hypothetical protein DPMN_085287 [Dreissena polymorpha]
MLQSLDEKAQGPEAVISDTDKNQALKYTPLWRFINTILTFVEEAEELRHRVLISSGLIFAAQLFVKCVVGHIRCLGGKMKFRKYQESV